MVDVTAMLFVMITLQYSMLSSGVELKYCRPRLKLIAIDSPYFNYFPYYAELHRCEGMCLTVSPRLLKCSAASTKMLSKTFYDLSRGNEVKVFQLANHTSCNCSCTQDPGSCHKELEVWEPEACNCKCRYSTEEPYSCPADFKWNQDVCKCLCDLPPKLCDKDKEWNKDYCGCLCSMDAFQRCAKQNKQMDKDTCGCYSQSPDTAARGGKGVDRSIMIGCMIAELLLLLILFDIFIYCRYGDGVVTFMRRKFCSKKRRDPEPIPAVQKDTPESC